MFLKFSSAFISVFRKNKKPPKRNLSKNWWLLPDLNWGHKALQASALPTELKSQPFSIIQYKLFYCKRFLNFNFN